MMAWRNICLRGAALLIVLAGLGGCGSGGKEVEIELPDESQMTEQERRALEQIESSFMPPGSEGGRPQGGGQRGAGGRR